MPDEPKTDAPAEKSEQGKAMEVGQAMGQAKIEAADAGKTPEEQRAAVEQAGRDKAEEVGLPITDKQLETMAGMLFGHLANLFETRGAFDAPPEPVAAVPPAPSEPGAEPPAPTEVVTPQRKSLAQRFLGE